MGNSFTCFSPRIISKPSSSVLDLPDPRISPSSSHNKKSRKVSSPLDDSFIKQQAQIASMLYQHHLQNNSDLLLHLDRSVSTKNPPSSYKKQKKLPLRSRSLSTSNQHSLQLFNQDALKSEGHEKKHFVLIHGGGFGAWCWYQIIALLKEEKCEVDAIDLTGSGLNFCDINSITSLQQYTKPLIDFLIKLEDGKEVSFLSCSNLE